MDTTQIISAIILGLVEGLTEFLPISSTGHLIVVSDILGFKGAESFAFNISIQLGAILAVCWKFRRRIIVVTATIATKPESRRFVLNVLLAFLPAAVLGALFHDYIKSIFTTRTVGISLVLGGFVIIWIENKFKEVKFEDVDDINPKTSLKIGLLQCIAMIPGVSRSGATIMGSLLMGISRKAAAEFSFFLAIPTMLGATVYSLYKNRNVLDVESAGLIAIGFSCAFIAALLVVGWLLNYISKHGFKPFAYYRIIVGSIIIAAVSF